MAAAAAAQTLPKRRIPKLDRSVTRLGFGAYRLSQPRHAEALIYALQQGIDVIDTGANFEQGQSESLIGQVLPNFNRKDITLITKAGYLSKKDVERYDNAQDYIHVQGNSFHGIAPRILQDQLEQSLERMQTNHIDIFLINAPERMLKGKGNVYQQLTDSFRFLDSLVQQKVIGGYGVCSNTLALPDATDHLRLSSILDACDRLDNFVAVQLPFNLYEPNAVQNNLLMDTIEQHDLFVLANRPLNAITPHGVRGLYNHMVSQPTDMADLRDAFERVARLEMDMISELDEERQDQDSVVHASKSFVWGQILSENLQRLGQHHFATRHYLTTQVKPQLQQDLALFCDMYADIPSYVTWANHYQAAMDQLVDALVNYSYMDTLKKNNDLDRIFSALVPWSHYASSCHSPLTVKALQMYLAQDELGCVLTGMRQPEYVDDALLAMKEYQQSPLTAQHLADLSRVLL
ncbi:Aldo/keto reductase [Hesseltinella vesiculosa]|uniref:Aldo/keto reductase n=1 Tax=Hesseltinella vesiculosa TaxID=101127 RepID=A0A1X2GNV9_9FUNG|nr:Aldo/keto reductase [Hesseltinella vesiculosa]